MARWPPAGMYAFSTTCNGRPTAKARPAWVPRRRFHPGRRPQPPHLGAGAGRDRRRLPPGGLRRLHAGDRQVHREQRRRHGIDAGDDPRQEPARAQSGRRLVAGGLQRGSLPLPGARTLSTGRPALSPSSSAAIGMSTVRSVPLSPRRSRPTRRRRPAAENVYAISKLVQERLVISWGRATGIPAVALRYSCTYGPRQSLFNPYTGVIAIFCTRLANDLPPVVYEDGRQSRDLIFVEDVARANLLVADDPRATGRSSTSGRDRPRPSATWPDCSRSGWASRSPRCSLASSGRVRCGP